MGLRLHFVIVTISLQGFQFECPRKEVAQLHSIDAMDHCLSSITTFLNTIERCSLRRGDCQTNTAQMATT